MESTAAKSQVCFWDKHPFTGKGVMCPISYKPAQCVRKKKEYIINENIEYFQVKNQVSCKPQYIIYDDMFCSLQCCLAWIEDNCTKPKYKNSKHIVYNELMKENSNCLKLEPASDWRTLKTFGGFQTIEEFRTNKNTLYLADQMQTDNQITYKYVEVFNM